MNIRHYLDDGANYKAQMILAYLRNRANLILEDAKLDTDGFMNRIEVGRYENCREQGYVFTLNVGFTQKHFAVYEHRNSDDIIVLISNRQTINTPNVDDMWADKGENCSKWDYDKAFPYNGVMECCEWLYDTMVESAIEMDKEN